ncbi:hypothetical protein B0T09DRAFT_411198 [Sordaria sp. MPI-SDFR-AT-0083]|nr:hypothetical protein B0T09DRAFT_411198 [Sordaria sp. MPI-SDFR-AT-0083]
MGRKDRNPAWREANIWEKPKPARRYSTWATTTTWRTSTWGSDHADPDPDPEAHIQPEEQQEEEEDGKEKETKKKKKKPSIWRSLACGMKTALACDMFKPAFPWIALPFPRIQRLLHHSGTRNRRKRRPINTTHVSTFGLDPESLRKHQTRRLDLVHGVAMNTGTSTAKITENVNTASNNPRTVSQEEDQKREISRWARRGRN